MADRENTIRSDASGEESTENSRPLNVEAIMQRIREEVKSEIEDSSKDSQYGQGSSFIPSSASASRLPLIHREELNYLNANWHSLLQQEEVSSRLTSHRKLFGPFIVRTKRFILNTVWTYLLKGYFERERQFHMQLVRQLNDAARYIDVRDADIISQLMARLDAQQAHNHESIQQTAAQKSWSQELGITRVRERLEQLESDRNHLVEVAHESNKDVSELEETLRSLEESLSLLGKALAPAQKEALLAEKNVISSARDATAPAIQILNNGVDRLIETNRLSDSTESVRARFQAYVPFFEKTSGKVLQLETGRGEFLELLRESGKEAVGTESDQALSLRLREKGLQVVTQQPLDFLEQVPEGSLGGIFLSEFLEKVSPEDYGRLFELISRKLSSEAVVVIECANVESLSVLSQSVYRQPRLQRPLHGDAVQLLLETHGFHVEQSLLVSPFTLEERLPKIAMQEGLPSRWIDVLQDINKLVQRLNEKMFGHKYITVVARRTKHSEQSRG